MNLEQIAQQAMDYLDSVGVAADYEIKVSSYGIRKLTVFTDYYDMGLPSNAPESTGEYFIGKIKKYYPQKSPAK